MTILSSENVDEYVAVYPHCSKEVSRSVPKSVVDVVCLAPYGSGTRWQRHHKKAVTGYKSSLIDHSGQTQFFFSMYSKGTVLTFSCCIRRSSFFCNSYSHEAVVYSVSLFYQIGPSTDSSASSSLEKFILSK